LEALTESFRRTGYDGASMATIADDVGINKSALYHHFPGGKTDMALAVVDHVIEQFSHAVREAPEGEEARAFCKALEDYYGDGRLSCLIANMALSAPSPELASAVKKATIRWTGALARLASEVAGMPPNRARRWAEDAVIRMQGALVLSRALNDPSPLRRQLSEIRRELLS
jgi:AcrR family transcriptional regulator